MIFVGPDPSSPRIAHPGGQLTATRAFASFAALRGIAVTWIDTAQSSFPTPPPYLRIARALGRLWRFVQVARQRRHGGVLLFAGTGASFFERSFMVIIARLLGIPSVLMIASGHFRSFYSNNRLLQPLIRTLLNVPHRVAVQGENWQTYMEAIGVDAPRVAVVRNWCPPAFTHVERSGRRGGPIHFVFVGWITAAKGVPELLEAADILAERGRSFRLTLIGGGTLLEPAREAVAAKHFDDRISLPGWVDSSMIPAHLADADVFVLPSHTEGLPNSLIEAMAAGLPGIATPVGARPNSLEDGVAGLLVPVGDVTALAAAMMRYCDDRDLVERHSEAARRSVAVLHDAETNCAAMVGLLCAAPCRTHDAVLQARSPAEIEAGG